MSHNLPLDPGLTSNLALDLSSALGRLEAAVQRLDRRSEQPSASDPAQLIPLLETLHRLLRQANTSPPPRRPVPLWIPMLSAFLAPLLVLLVLTLFRPGWYLPPETQRTYLIGKECESLLSTLPREELARLRSLLRTTSQHP